MRAEDKIRRSTLQRTRVKPRDVAEGEMVLFWRKDKNHKKGAWRGPGVVVGRQQDNYWIARGGRCQLCAPEHVRPASPEELGGIFALRATRDDLQRLIERDHDDEDVYEDEAEDLPVAAEDDGFTLFDDISMGEEEETYLREFPNEDLDAHEDRSKRDRPTAEGDNEEPPSRRIRTKRPQRPRLLPGQPGAAQEAYMLKRAKTQRGRLKQLEKELPWNMIPVEHRDLFLQGEVKQWNEHIKFGALTPLDIETSRKIEAEEPSRILSSRYAYRDKNLAKRRTDPSAPWKAKSRLVVGGHNDPDVTAGFLRTDSPTVSRTAVMCIMQITAARLGEGWTLAAGDVTAAFLNGDALDRRLFLRQPKHGFPGLHPSQLVRIDKGIFGLIDSPRKWWVRFRSDIQEKIFDIGDNRRAKFFTSALDPCVFQLVEINDSNGERKAGKKPLCYAAVHVDDILLAGPRDLSQAVQGQISTCFPIEEWETDTFDFIGSHVEVGKESIRISQGGYVESRLFEIPVDTSIPEDAKADAEQIADNRSLIGALSWLASQTRPDLACGVSMAQQLQASPTIEDIKFTNLLARRALQYGQEAIELKKLDLNKLLVMVYHDAGWSNAPDNNEDPVYFLTPSDEERGRIDEGPWATKQRTAKKKHSKVASQLGMLVVFSEVGCVQGDNSCASVVEWKSHACERVCRSTFGAETMGCIEGIELAQYVRAMIGSFIEGELHRNSGENFPMLALTDCRSLYDHLHRDGLPRTPSDRRLAIDIACLRQSLQQEAQSHGGGRVPLAWVPTELQHADLLTKPKKAGDWWTASRSLLIPVKERLFVDQCKSEEASSEQVRKQVSPSYFHTDSTC